MQFDYLWIAIPSIMIKHTLYSWHFLDSPNNRWYWRHPAESLLSHPGSVCLRTAKRLDRSIHWKSMDTPPSVTSVDWQHIERWPKKVRRKLCLQWNHERWNMIQVLPLTSDPVTWPCDCLHFTRRSVTAPPPNCLANWAKLSREGKAVKTLQELLVILGSQICSLLSCRFC